MAVYLAVCAVVTLIAVVTSGETSRRDLAEDQALVLDPGRPRASV